MVSTYKQNPNFGDAKKFQSEVDNAIQKVQNLELELHSINKELAKTNSFMDTVHKYTGIQF